MPMSKPTSRSIFLWHKANFNTICNYIDEFTQNFLNTYDHLASIDILWQEFKSLCKTCLDMIPQAKAPSGSRPPWLSKSIKKLTRVKQRKYNTACRTNSPENWSAYYDLKKQVQKLCRASHNSYVLSLLDSNNKVTKKFWKYIKSMCKDTTSINVLHSNGEDYTGSETKANILNSQFAFVFTKHLFLACLINLIPQISVTVDSVYNLLANLDGHKATGPDNIPSRFLKEFAKQIAPALMLIFQSSINQGKLPCEWKIANITPIHKKNNRADPTNYRPISLTSICCKTLEHIIYSSISPI